MLNQLHLRPLSLLLTLTLCLGLQAQTLPEGVVSDGEGWMFRDPLYGYSLLYPGGCRLKGAAELRRADSKTKRDEGLRFMLRVTDPGCKAVEPSLIGSIKGIDPRLGPVTQHDLAERNHSSTCSRPEITQLETLGDISVGGIAFERFTYQRQHTKTGKPLLTRIYFHFDAQARLGYTFALTSCKEHAAENFEALESVLATIRLARLPGPAPCEALGPTGHSPCLPNSIHS